MSDFRRKLIRRFRQQVAFADGYSPLYARLFGALADWCEDTGDPVTGWLLQASQTRASFDVPLLLAAALHRDVLAGETAVASLARYYPTAGGQPPAAEDAVFDRALRQAIIARADALAAFIQSSHVQTNETGRGLAWLLPLSVTGWERVHLVDLGASAGLNLVAERRSYRLVDNVGRVFESLGNGRPVQFTTICHGETAARPASARALPTIIGRDGGDQAPFQLDGPADELRLMAFIWGDQPARLARLREGLAARRQVQLTDAPIRLHPLTLPDGLPEFLQQVDAPAPMLIYNTFITVYLPDRGAALSDDIGRWAATRQQPVIWVQWEPRRDGRAPQTGWCAWTVDLWQHGRHHRWQLAWCHPHGTEAQFLPGWRNWLASWAR